ncbi:MAG: PKD domain-containing protein, partial [Bacteroidales bacterium]
KIMNVRNDSISEISNTSAKAFATIIDIGPGVDQHGHCWSINTEPTIIANEGITENGQANTPGKYSSTLTGLSQNTKYYVRAYVEKGGTVVYGTDILPFTTLSISKPVVTTGEVTLLSTTGATVTGNLTSLGEGASSVTQYGHCWSSETTTPVIEDDSKSSLGTTDKTGNFESQLVGLTTGTLYYVRAYATNDAGTAYGDTLKFKTYGLLNAGFTASPTKGFLPLNVQFTDISIGDITSWSWNFGDGGTSGEENPLYTYNDQGIYSVTLTVSDGNRSDSETKTDYIAVSAAGTAPVANFTADKTSIIVGETVNFTDLSLNNPTSWSWNFGDEGTSSSQNPSHQYNTEGIYTVSLSATNSYGTDNETKSNYISVSSEPPETVTDYDGNEYNTIQIGVQTWMAEDLATTHYSDGSALVDGTGAGDITGDFTTKFYFNYNDNQSNVATYGRLYTWAAVMNGASSSNSNPSGVQGVCPAGWHVPGDDEWKQLEMHLGMTQGQADGTDWRGTNEGGKLKESGTTHWSTPNEGATNESGFTALPGGFRGKDGTFGALGDGATYWLSTQYNSSWAWYRTLWYGNQDVHRNYHEKESGRSVRCVKNYE